MNKVIISFCFLLSLIFLHSSCSTDVDLLAPEKEMIAAYGLLNPNSNTQYVKIYRVFNSPDTSAIELASDPDEIYYADGVISVKVVEVNTGREFQFERVDLATTEIGNLDQLGPFESGGAFPETPNIGYVSDFSPREGEAYELIIEHQQLDLTVKGRTDVVESYRVLQPYQTIPWRTTNINNIKFQWEKPSSNRIFDVNLHIYNEIRNPEFTEVLGNEELVIPMVRTSSNDELTVIPDAFYRKIDGIVDPTPNGEIRRVDSIKVSVTAGNRDLSNYINFNKAQSSAGASQSLGIYTNLENGVGVFASKTKEFTVAIEFEQSSLDTLACGQFTNQLGFAVFQNINVNPNFPFCD